MKSKLLFPLLIILSCVASVWAQTDSETTETPMPKIWWTFDYSDWSESKFNAVDADGKALDGATAKTTNIAKENFVPDRNGTAEGALEMPEAGTIDFSADGANKMYGLMPLFVAGDDTDDLDSVTVAVWVYFDKETKTDTERLIFAASQTEDGEVKFGLSVKDTTLYLKRYFEQADGTVGVPWSYECFQPAAFDAGTGWYYLMVILGKTQKYMRIFLGKPNEGGQYGPGAPGSLVGAIGGENKDNVVKRTFDGRLIWIPGIRDGLKDFNYWFLGNAKDLIFDDLMIFNWALSQAEAEALWNDQYDVDTEARIAQQDTDDTYTTATTTVAEVPDLLYPNPTSGKFQVQFTLTQEEDITIRVATLTGILVDSQQAHLDQGSHTLNFDLTQAVASGIYIVHVDGIRNTYFAGRLLIE